LRRLSNWGVCPITASDSSGFIYDPDGIDTEKLEFIKELKNVRRGRIKEYAEHYGCGYYPNERPWNVPCDIALPCATQNELDEADAKALVKNGCMLVAEGANMPSTPEAIEVFQNSDQVLYAPGKASNAGGVATSGLEMSQNSLRLSWTREEVDVKLKGIMRNIHEMCLEYGTDKEGQVDYVKGANIAGFVRVADAMLAEGTRLIEKEYMTDEPSALGVFRCAWWFLWGSERGIGQAFSIIELKKCFLYGRPDQ
jgi:glutamate dehydrogenase (NADP+)